MGIMGELVRHLRPCPRPTDQNVHFNSFWVISVCTLMLEKQEWMEPRD